MMDLVGLCFDIFVNNNGAKKSKKNDKNFLIF